jgi:hypothetical protein
LTTIPNIPSGAPGEEDREEREEGDDRGEVVEQCGDDRVGEDQDPGDERPPALHTGRRGGVNQSFHVGP